MAATVVSIINLKGGVGKSTITMMLGEFLSFRFNKKVLLIDMDAQANLTYAMVSPNETQEQRKNERTLYHMFKKILNGQMPPISDFITSPPSVVSNIDRHLMNTYACLDMIISEPDVAQLDDELISLWISGKKCPENLQDSLNNCLKSIIKNYDYIILDCPPGLSIFSSTALIASDFFICPVIPEPLSLQGVDLILRRAAALKEHYENIPQFRGIILNIVKHNRKTHSIISARLYGQQILDFAPFEFDYKPFNNWLPDNERIRKLGEFEAELIAEFVSSWGIKAAIKFNNLYDKYSLNYYLKNPSGGGALDRSQSEGPAYKLLNRMISLVEEFMKRTIRN